MSNNRFPFEENHYYHIYNRGFNKKKLFFREEDYKIFFSYFEKYIVEYTDALEVVAYCVLGNHFHLILRCKETGLKISDFMRKLQVAYSMYYKRKYNENETGLKQPVFEGRFSSLLIDSDSYLQRCEAYVNYNALKHEIVTDILDWPYSSIHQILEEVSIIPKTHIKIS